MENNKDIQTPLKGDGDNVDVLQVTADTAEAETKGEAAAGLGKFKSVDALMSAYLSLEAEFTRRSKRLKELEAGNKAQDMPEKDALSPEGEQDILKAALSSESVKAAVVSDYLKTLAKNKCTPLIVGGVSACAEKSKPKSVKEAGALAERFLKN